MPRRKPWDAPATLHALSPGGSLRPPSQRDHFDWYDRSVFENAWQESVVAELRVYIFVGALNKTAQSRWNVVVVPADFRTGYTWTQASPLEEKCSVWEYLVVMTGYVQSKWEKLTKKWRLHLADKYNVSLNNTTLYFIYGKNSVLSGRHVSTFIGSSSGPLEKQIQELSIFQCIVGSQMLTDCVIWM